MKMDPDRYQMKDMKRRLVAAEKAANRANGRIDRLNSRIVVMSTSLKRLEKILTHID